LWGRLSPLAQVLLALVVYLRFYDFAGSFAAALFEEGKTLKAGIAAEVGAVQAACSLPIA
jgi:hypothetical protein